MHGGKLLHGGNFVSAAVNNYRRFQCPYDSALLLAADKSVTVGAFIFSEADVCGTGALHLSSCFANVFKVQMWKN